MRRARGSLKRCGRPGSSDSAEAAAGAARAGSAGPTRGGALVARPPAAAVPLHRIRLCVIVLLEALPVFGSKAPEKCQSLMCGGAEVEFVM